MRYVGSVLILLLCLAGCGDNIVEIGGLSGSARPGRVSLMNNWSRTAWAEYTDQEGKVVETTIEAGETKLISGDYTFDGGNEVYFILEFEYNPVIRKRIRVTIDGNVLVVINLVRGQGDVLGENFEVVSIK